MKMRTIEQAAAWLQENDPETALTKTALRRLVVTGKLPCIRVGQKYLIALETLEDYLAGAVPLPPSRTVPEIRRVEL